MRDLFSEKGEITDVQLKHTKDGVFRKFAFIGFRTEQEASQAISYFDNTCIDTSRIKVQASAALGAEDKPQSWSKHAKDSSTYKNLHGIKNENANETQSTSKQQSIDTKKNKKQRLEEIFGEHKNDPKFIEFMKVHGKGNDIWDNDLGLIETTDNNANVKEKKTLSKSISGNNLESSVSDENDSNNEENNSQSDGDEETVKLADQNISDTDYLKSLMNKKNSTTTEDTNETNENKKIDNLFTVKIREIPFTTKRKDIIKFFKPVKAFSIRLPTRTHGFCYVGFKTEKDFKKAMLKNRSFLNGKQVILIDFTEKNKEAACKEKESIDAKDKRMIKNPKWAKQEEALKNEEDISDSGRVFFRNLSYTVTEEQLQELFEKYGPVTEVNLPIDKVTRKIKGFGTVTFVMPEDAVRAFSELDGSTFHGRLLHLIPAKSKEEDENNIDTEGLSYKQKKELELRKAAGSAHNWNSLFMGANAVANILAKNYDTTKEQILDTSGGGSSAAVRLALGETEIILEMRKFLELNDVVLDVFNQIPKKRSKTVILVKNLPADTTIGDLQPLFTKFGLLGRIVLPPSGVTAIVEYLDASEAKKAFSKLAYTKFKNLPLYLEWAPENTFKAAATKPIETISLVKDESNVDTDDQKSKSNPFSKDKKRNSSKDLQKQNVEEFETYVINEVKQKDPPIADNNDNEEDDTEPENQTTLFLRNLKFTTVSETIQEHFKHLGKIHHVQVAMKKDPDNPRNKIPLGYGFIQFKQKASAEKALKTMETTNIDGNIVELKRSDRTLQ